MKLKLKLRERERVRWQTRDDGYIIYVCDDRNKI